MKSKFQIASIVINNMCSMSRETPLISCWYETPLAKKLRIEQPGYMNGLHHWEHTGRNTEYQEARRKIPLEKLYLHLLKPKIVMATKIFRNTTMIVICHRKLPIMSFFTQNWLLVQRMIKEQNLPTLRGGVEVLTRYS